MGRRHSRRRAPPRPGIYFESAANSEVLISWIWRTSGTNLIAAAVALQNSRSRLCPHLAAITDAGTGVVTENLQEVCKRLTDILLAMAVAGILRDLNLKGAAVAFVADLLQCTSFTTKPHDLLPFFVRVATSCDTPHTNDTVGEILAVALESIRFIFADARAGTLEPKQRTELLEVVLAPLVDSLHRALFPDIESVSDMVANGEESHSAFSSLGEDDGSSPSDKESQTPQHIHREKLVDSSDRIQFGRYTRSGRIGMCSTQVRLRLSALDALASLATVSSAMLVPYWGLFLPCRDGTANVTSCPHFLTLANIVLHDRNKDTRSAAVNATIALISGSGHFLVSLPIVPKEQAKESLHAFTSAGTRVSRVCSALYSIVASAIRRETAPCTLARLMKLATELSQNANVPFVHCSRVMILVEALQQRVVDAAGIDRTSRSAALACMALALSTAAESSITLGHDLNGLLVSIMQILEEPTAPIAEALAALQSVLQVNPSAAEGQWNDIEFTLKRILCGSEGDDVARLHVARCLLAVLRAMQKYPWNFPAGRNILDDIWNFFLSASLQDSFHAVRACSLQSVDVLFQIMSAVPRQVGVDSLPQTSLAARCLSVVGKLLKTDDTATVRCAAVKALSQTPSHGNFCLVKEAYVCLVDCIMYDRNISVRSRAMLASGSILEMEKGSIFKCSINDDAGVLFRKDCHKREAIALLCNEGTSTVRHESDRSMQAESDSLRSSCLWTLGCFLFCSLHDYGSELFLSLDEIHRILVLICKVTSSITENPKLRWNACHVLGRCLSLLQVGYIEEEVQTEILTVLCFAMTRGMNYKVRIAAVKSLRTGVQRQILKVDTVVRLALADVDEISLRATCAPSCDSLHVQNLRSDFKFERDGLILDLLCSPELELTNSRNALRLIPCDIFFDAIWNHACLPTYALKVVDGPSASVSPDCDAHEAAMDAWKSLPPECILALARAAEIAIESSDESVARTRLTSAAALLKGSALFAGS